MNRRDVLRGAGAWSGVLGFSRAGMCAGAGGDSWRTFEVTTRVEVLKASGPTRIWVPAALIGKTAYQRTLSNDFVAEGGTARLVESPADGLRIVDASFPAGAKP